MMGLAMIESMSREAAIKAASERLEPFLVQPGLGDEVVFEQLRGLPNLGSYDPPGWERIESLFVDATGHGEDDEPALSVRQFTAKVQELLDEHGPLGFGIGDCGMFQVYVNVFRKVPVEELVEDYKLPPRWGLTE